MNYHINFLPWRENRNMEITKIFFLRILFVTIFIVVISLIVRYVLQHQINLSEKDGEYLNEEILKLQSVVQEVSELEKKKERYQRHINLLRSLEQDRFLSLEIFNALSVNVIQGLHLTKIIKKGGQICCEGKASSYAIIANFIEKLSCVPIFSDASLKEVEVAKDNKNKSGQEFMDVEFAIDILLKTTDIGH